MADELSSVANQQEQSSSSPKGKNNNKIIIIVVAVLAVLVVLNLASRYVMRFASQKVAGGFLSAMTGGKAKVDLQGDGGKVTIKGDDGNVLEIDSNGSATLNKNYPVNDVPIYPGTTIIASSSYGSGNDMVVTAALQTNAKVDDVLAFYESHFSSSDWTEEMSYDVDSSKIRAYESKSRNMSANISIGDDDSSGVTSLVISIIISSQSEE